MFCFISSACLFSLNVRFVSLPLILVFVCLHHYAGGGAETGKPENMWEIHTTFYKSWIIIAEVNF
jgi:hypothetical protein